MTNQAKKIQYIIIGDFIPCPECTHLGAEHDGGILAPMKCHHLDDSVECPCILDGVAFQILVDSTPSTGQGTGEQAP
jgi:hypothetical protein